MKDSDTFFEKVYEVVKKIPYGKVTSYGAIAVYLGMAKSARMVGWALNSNRLENSVPAHRVVNRNGILTGKHHFGGSELMQQLLENEDIRVKNSQVQDFKAVFWDPNKHLER